jgi:hypothetical protein
MRQFLYADYNTRKIRFIRALRQRIEDLVQERDSFASHAICARKAGDWQKLGEARDVLEGLSRELAGLHAVAVASASDPKTIRDASDWKHVMRALRAECLLLKQEIEAEANTPARSHKNPSSRHHEAVAA